MSEVAGAARAWPAGPSSAPASALGDEEDQWLSSASEADEEDADEADDAASSSSGRFFSGDALPALLQRAGDLPSDDDLLGAPALPLPTRAPSWRARMWDSYVGNVFWGIGSRRRGAAAPLAAGAGGYGTLHDAPEPAFSPSEMQTDPGAPSRRPPRGGTSLGPVGYRTRRTGPDPDASVGDVRQPLLPPGSPSAEGNVLQHAFRPTRAAIDRVLSSMPRRYATLVGVPVALVLLWCAVPFPTSSDEPERRRGYVREVDANFWFFLFWYYGVYVAVALVYVTQLFTLYRLNWWPAALGAKTSYSFFWCLSLACGYALHRLNPLSTGRRHRHSGKHDAEEEERQLQLKTEWVLLAFATMAMPACVCFVGLQRRGRQRLRPRLTAMQKTFAGTGEARRRIPSSYRRFLWFMGTMTLTLFTLLLGQAYAIAYLSAGPHTGLEGTLYVAFWMLTVHVLSFVTQWIMLEKVRNRTLLFVLKYYYFMVYFIFYRNLFARLRSFDQFALIQLLSTSWVCLWYPFTMSKLYFRIVSWLSRRRSSWEEHIERVGLFFYLRNLVQHTTMLSFLGWLSVLHFGVNQSLYPFFASDEGRDPFNYRLTVMGSFAIWAAETVSVWMTTGVRCEWRITC